MKKNNEMESKMESGISLAVEFKIHRQLVTMHYRLQKISRTDWSILKGYNSNFAMIRAIKKHIHYKIEVRTTQFLGLAISVKGLVSSILPSEIQSE